MVERHNIPRPAVQPIRIADKLTRHNTHRETTRTWWPQQFPEAIGG